MITLDLLREGVSNTITQLRFPGFVFLELHHWANRVKYVLQNISKLCQDFSPKLFVRIGWTSGFVLNQTKREFPMKFGTFGPFEIEASATSTPRLRLLTSTVLVVNTYYRKRVY